MAKRILGTELETYERNKEELLKKYSGKFVLIKDTRIIGAFESEKDAINTGIKMFGNTPFLVKKIESVEQTQNFTSNLINCVVSCHP